MANNKNTYAGCDNLIDDAFEPQMGVDPRGTTMQSKLRSDAGDKNAAAKDAAELTLADLLAGRKISSKRWETPDIGFHYVVLDCKPEVKTGKDGPYVQMRLVDVSTQQMWICNKGADKLMETLESISNFNHGMLAGLSAVTALNKLTQSEFQVGIGRSDTGNCVTYFNLKSFERWNKFWQNREAERELKELRYRERKDNEARMAEEAELTQKATTENTADEKAPF